MYIPYQERDLFFHTGHYQKQERLKEVERCLVHLDLVNLDIDQVLKNRLASCTCVCNQWCLAFMKVLQLCFADCEAVLEIRTLWCCYLCLQSWNGRLWHSSWSTYCNTPDKSMHSSFNNLTFSYTTFQELLNILKKMWDSENPLNGKKNLKKNENVEF